MRGRHAAIAAIVLRASAPAAGAQGVAGPVSRADLSVSAGWFNADKSELSSERNGNDWYNHSLYGGGAFGWYWTDHLKTEVEEKTKALQDAIKENDISKMRESQTALQDALNRAGQAVYTAAQAEAGAAEGGPDGEPGPDGQPGAGGQPGGGSRPGTVEGEFREV